ncbi:hypothetical protein BS47DRAFT_123309 [Hydnum rufescens UP504]|uniref:non-specific serine/threonine protein kinase n=1 Tax=Hydnum rufescens UP504 TaxID=1448309 RepID=A0A9P6DY29_9AGAM|nr:hypothetical protein BS47DRAFT_123309 [Hydnum rufescens UP504]
MPAAPKARYAVKAVLNSLHESARVQRETEAHLHLRVSGHRGILTLHRVIREKHFMYFVLDLCPSGDLFDAVSRGMYFRRLPDIKSIFLQLIDAVEHCHSLGIFHRDLKLENILLKNQEGEPPHIVLSDFGLATEEIRAHDPIGSRMYMSPECLACKSAIPDYDCAPNDVWSMGIILVILILGNSAPWEVASHACPIFWDYVKNAHDFFTARYSMTAETNALMTKVFELIPSDRISLRDLRPAVDALNEFISTPVEKNIMALFRKMHRRSVCPLNTLLAPDLPVPHSPHTLCV